MNYINTIFLKNLTKIFFKIIIILLINIKILLILLRNVTKMFLKPANNINKINQLFFCIFIFASLYKQPTIMIYKKQD